MFSNFTSLSAQVSDGLTTLIDVTLNCSSSGCGVWLRPGSACTLVMHRCKVLGSSSSAIQVGAGWTGLEMDDNIRIGRIEIGGRKSLPR